MEKNIAALLRTDAYTVHVSFNVQVGGGTTYCYVSNLPLQVNDLVVVKTKTTLDVARVEAIDPTVSIAPNSGITYSWVVAKVDMTECAKNLTRNQEIEATVADAYRRNLQRSFAQQILLAVLPEDQERLQKLLGA